jgi:hypothetical protein
MKCKLEATLTNHGPFYGARKLSATDKESLERWCRLPKLDPDAGRCAGGVRAMESNVPRTRSVGPLRAALRTRTDLARELGAPATACPAPPPIEATAIRAPRSPPLGVALQPVGWVARARSTSFAPRP